MFPYRCDPDGARLRLVALLSGERYANISLLEADERTIPFHLSLRRDAGLVAINTRGPGQADWGREIQARLPTAATRCTVEIRLTPRSIDVWIDRTRVFRLRPQPLRRWRFERISDVRRLDLQGSFPVAGVEVCPAEGRVAEGVLTLTDRLELRTLTSGQPLAPVLHLDGPNGSRHAIAASVAPYPDSGADLWEVAALLPGRIWQGVSDDTPLHAALVDDGARLAECDLTRDDLRRAIMSLSDGLPADYDIVQSTQIVEHARCSGLADLLPANSLRTLSGIAAQRGLGAFLGASPPVPQVAARPAPPVPDATALAIQALAGWLNENAAASDDIILSRLRAAELPAPDMAVTGLRLADLLCSTGHADAYVRFLTGPDTPPVPHETGANWRDAALLPVHWASGEPDLAADAIWRLIETEDWLPAGPIGDLLCRAVDDIDVAWDTRSRAIYGVMDLIRRHAEDYWSNAQNENFVRAGARLVAAADRLPAYLVADTASWALSVYGLSAAFWSALDDLPAASAADPRIAPARSAFRALDKGCEEAEAHAALDLLERAGCMDAVRARTELAPKTAWMHRDGSPEVGDALLRYAASPSGDVTVPADRVSTVQQAVRNAYRPHPAGQFTMVQRATGHWAHDVAFALKIGAVPDALIEPGLTGLVSLSSADACFRGLALGCALIQLAASTDPAFADRIAKRLLPTVVPYVSNIPAGRHAAARLAGVHQTTPAIAALAAALNASADPAGQTTGLFDTQVVILTCRANLDTRVPVIRRTWARDLSRLGVEAVFVTGDGDGSRSGDVVALDAPDDYEGLPLKTLAAIRWVLDRTPAQHMLKVDDDCLLNADETFLGLTLLGHDYLGRVLHRGQGQMDRMWHLGRPTSRGLSLDKSPEPSVYADGGCGYALSRHAMTAIRAEAETTAGRRLVETSIMEDKLVGDLASLAGLTPASDNWQTTVLRCATGAVEPVTQWVDGVYPSAAAPTKLIHLDGYEQMEAAHGLMAKPEIWPKKIWPTYAPAILGRDTNSLQYVGSRAALKRASEADIAVVAVMRNETFMVSHFLDHYRALGVDAFLIADNRSDDGTREVLAAQPDVALFSAHTDYGKSHYGVAWQQAMLSACRVGRWSLLADADELLLLSAPGVTDRPMLADITADADADRSDAFRVFMLDIYPGGPLADADFKDGPFARQGYTDRDPFLTVSTSRGPFSNQPTWTSAVRHRLIPGTRPELFVAQKIALLRYRPWHRLTEGLHYMSDMRLSERELIFGHMKYNADFRRRAVEETSRREHFNDAEEYRKYLDLASEGRDTVYDAAISVPWQDAEFVARRLIASRAGVATVKRKKLFEMRSN